MKTKEQIEDRIIKLKVIQSEYIVIMKSMCTEEQRFGFSVDLKCIDNRIDELEGVLNSESQVDVSASTGESDVLHDVVECNAERKDTTKINKEDVEGTLEKIIDCESICPYCERSNVEDGTGYLRCKGCDKEYWT